MTDLGPLGDPAAGVCLGVVGPSVSTTALADAWLDHHDDAVVLIGRCHQPCQGHRSTGTHADRRLAASGWVVPAPMVGAGSHLGEPGMVAADDWFEHFRHSHPEHADFVETVGSPTSVVDSLEDLLADLVIPTPDGLTPWGGQLIDGDRTAIGRRARAIAERVPEFDEQAVAAARPPEADRRVVVDALSSYVRWCLDAGVATSGLRLAAAALHTDADEGSHVLLVTDGRPATAELDLAFGMAAESVGVAVRAVPTGPTWTAWTPDAATVRSLLEQRAEGTEWDAATVVSIDELPESGSTSVAPDRPPQTASTPGGVDSPDDVYTHDVDDPVGGAVDVLAGLLDGDVGVPSEEPPEPSDVCVTARPASRARRFMRLAVDRGLPVARAGPVDVYRTRIAVLSLAWLRIIEGIRPDRGWAVVLEEAGCSPGDLDAWLDGDERPAVFASVRGQLKALGDGTAVIAAVADRYGADPRATHALIDELTDGTDAPSKMATLDRLAGRSAEDGMVHLEPAPAGTTRISVRPPKTAPVILHVDGTEPPSSPALAYRPPLGAFTTRRIETVAGHAVERPAPAWATASAVSPDGLERRRWRAIASTARARRYAVLVGAPPCLAGVGPLDR